MERIYSLKEKASSFSNVQTVLFTYILAFVIALLVYYTGGTNRVFANFMYLPIILSATLLGKSHAILLALLCGLLVGPFMPLDTVMDTMQHPINWISRIVVYVLVASITGHFVDNYRKLLDEIVITQKEVYDAQLATIYSLVKLSEARDDDTGTHIQRVAIYCKLIAKELRNNPKYKNYIDETYISNLYRVSPLHDVGKVAIQDQILLKPGKLTPQEFEIIKTHTTIGAKTLGEVNSHYPNNKFLEMGVSIAQSHHEKWDGSGYPLGLHGENIPLSSRIMALADTYDALRSKRVYKPAYPHKECVEIIKASRGSHFDPEIVDVFIMLEKEFSRVFYESVDI